ncbi:MAG: helix-turn-helix domain-containing protein [Chloroflexota bacterium]
MPAPTAFGPWLQRQLTLRGMNQAEFARRARVSTSLVSNWINGNRTPSIQSAQAIAGALDMGVDTVLARLGLPVASPASPERERLGGLLDRIDLTPDRAATLAAILQQWADADRSPGHS